MRVAECPVRDQHFTNVGFEVAIRVGEIQRLGSVLHDAGVAEWQNRRRDAEVLSEDREPVGLAVAVGVFRDLDLVAALVVFGEFVGIVDSLAQPQPTTLVPVHRDRFRGELRFVSEELQLETFRHAVMLQGFLSRQRLLHLCDRLRLSAPAVARRVIRNLRPDLDVLERLYVLWNLRHRGDVKVVGIDIRAGLRGIVAAGPADTAFHKVMKTGIRPSSLIVSPGRVEDAAFAVRPRPGPGLLAVAFVAVLQHGAVLLIVLRMDVGLVPALEAPVALQQRMCLAGFR